MNGWAAVRVRRDVNHPDVMHLGPILVPMPDRLIGSMVPARKKGPSAGIVSDAPRKTYAHMTECRIWRHSDSAVRPKRVAPPGPLESTSMLPLAALAVVLSAVGTLVLRG